MLAQTVFMAAIYRLQGECPGRGIGGFAEMESPFSHAATFKMKPLSMKARMAVAVSLLFVVFAATIAYFSTTYFEEKFRQSIAGQQYVLACAIANGIDDKLTLAQQGLLAASSNVTPGTVAKTEDAQRFLDSRPTLHSLFDTTLFLLDKDGALIAESPFLPDRRGLNLAYQEYWRKTVATGKPIISSPYNSSISHSQPEVMLTAPVFDSSDKLTCILCGGLKLMGANLLSEVPRTRIGATGYAYLVTSDRTIIAHPDKSRIMQKVPPVVKNRLLDRALTGFDGSGETINEQGNLVVASFKHLRTTNWILALNFPVSEAYAPMYKSRQYLLAGIAAGTLAMLVLTWLVMRRLTLPLTTVTRQVEAMGEGTGALRLLNCGSSDEIGTLTAAFNRLIEKIHHQQETLRENEKKYRIVADNTYDWEFWLSPEQRYLYSSPSCERITGVDAAEFLASPDLLVGIIHPDDRERYLDHREQTGKNHGLHTLEFRIVRADDGAVRWISHLCHPVYDDEGKYLGTRGSYRDITERKGIEEQVVTLNRHLADHAHELEFANRELEAFSYTVSHDLRAPLTHISLCCQVITTLYGDKLDEQCKSYLLDIYQAIARMNQLITSLLDFARIARSELNRETVYLSDMARVIAAELQLDQINRRATFTIAEEIWCYGDANLLRVALMNLLGNACKYTGKKETAVIEFGVMEVEGKRAFFVRDNGAGFDMEQADKLFVAFQRLHSGNEFDGHGIGLATVQRIINRHGGQIWAEGEVGKGATFYFTLQ
jgi:PAS domain S-box-containing protein